MAVNKKNIGGGMAAPSFSALGPLSFLLFSLNSKIKNGVGEDFNQFLIGIPSF